MSHNSNQPTTGTDLIGAVVHANVSMKHPPDDL